MNNALSNTTSNVMSNEHNNFQCTAPVLTESQIKHFATNLTAINEGKNNVLQNDSQRKQHTLINNVLSSFTGHGLNDLNNANLMNRVDTKFILPIHFLAELLQQVKEDYTVLDIGQKRIFSYHNQYLDSADMRFYQDHHNGKLNRFKIRRRNYLDTNTEYLEVKFKNNKKEPLKRA